MRYEVDSNSADDDLTSFMLNVKKEFEKGERNRKSRRKSSKKETETV